MKKTSFSFLCLLSFFMFHTTSIQAETTASSIKKAEELTLPTGNSTTYAVVKKGKTLNPIDFIPMIEKNHDITVKDIEFNQKQKGNTMTIGPLKIEVHLTTSDNQSFFGTFPYLVENNAATIFLEDITYTSHKRKLSLKASNPNASVFMKADDKIYLLPLDNNGYFEGKYNPGVTPNTLQFIALDDNGNYSNEHVLFSEQGEFKDTPALKELIYEEETKTIQGSVAKDTSLVEEVSEDTLTTATANTFSYTYDSSPESIILSLQQGSKKETIDFEPINKTATIINELQENNSQLKPLKENRTQHTIIILTIIVILVIILFLANYYLAAKKQN